MLPPYYVDEDLSDADVETAVKAWNSILGVLFLSRHGTSHGMCFCRRFIAGIPRLQKAAECRIYFVHKDVL